MAGGRHPHDPRTVAQVSSRQCHASHTLKEDHMTILFHRRILALTIPVMVLLALLAVAGCGSSSSGNTAAPTATTAPAATATAAPTNTTGAMGNAVNVANFQFSPSMLTVKVGTTVTWKGVSGSHTVTSDAGAPMMFDQPISQGGTVTVTFTKAGTYNYHCSIHASMHGTIVVTA
jgi:plastocyanin